MSGLWLKEILTLPLKRVDRGPLLLHWRHSNEAGTKWSILGICNEHRQSVEAVAPVMTTLTGHHPLRVFCPSPTSITSFAKP